MGFWTAFSLWNRQKVMQDTFIEKDAVRLNNALAAEDRVADALRSLGHTHVFTRRRVYVESQSRNREIDVILICGKGIYVIEVKNWTGQVWRHGIKWFQLANKGGRALEFEDLMDECSFKAKALAAFLRKKHKSLAKLKDSDVHSILVFTNPNVRLDPVSVVSMGNVFTVETLKTHIGAAESWLASTLTYYVSAFAPAIPDEAQKAASEALDKMKTWDTVVLHNGTMIHGDVLGLEAPSFGLSLDRDEVSNMTLEWCGTTLWGLVCSLWQGGAAMMKVNLSNAARKKLAKKSKVDKKVINTEGDVRFLIKDGKRKVLQKNDRIIVRPAGKPGTEEHCLCDIKSIEYQGRDAIK